MTLEQMKTIKKNFGVSAREISEGTKIPFGTVQKIFTGETVTCPATPTDIWSYTPKKKWRWQDDDYYDHLGDEEDEEIDFDDDSRDLLDPSADNDSDSE